MSDRLVQAMQTAAEVAIGEINTMQPATIVSYDPATNRAVVRPTIPKTMADGTVLPPPLIHEVPIQWPGQASSGGVGFTMPIRPGDSVLLHHSSRSLEQWGGGDDSSPDDPRQHDLSDCIATPGGAATGVTAHPENVVLRFGSAELHLRPDGSATLFNGAGGLNIDASGNATYTGDLTVTGDVVIGPDAISFLQHVHKDTEPGGGFSGIPKA